MVIKGLSICAYQVSTSSISSNLYQPNKEDYLVTWDLVGIIFKTYQQKLKKRLEN